MKVFFLPRWFPVPDDPLWGLFVLNHALAVARYADVRVIYVDKSDQAPKGAKPYLTSIEGIPVVYTFYRGSKMRFPGNLINLYRMVVAWHRTWKFAVKTWGKPDINHVNILTRMGIFAFITKVLYGIPYIITEHWSRYLPQNMYYRGMFRKWFTRLVVRKAGAVLPVSNDLALAMQGFGLYNPEYHVVYNVVDTGLFNPAVEKQDTGKFTFIHISTFDDKAKNLSGIIRVVARLAQKRKDFRLRLIGDGIDFVKIKALVEELKIPPDTVTFEGACEQKGVAEALRESDILLMFSNYENMPVVIPEAFACGLPVIATRVGGIPEIVNDTNGYLIEPGDEEALEDLMDALLDMPVLPFDSELIHKDAVARFSSEKTGKQIFEYYKQVISL